MVLHHIAKYIQFFLIKYIHEHDQIRKTSPGLFSHFSQAIPPLNAFGERLPFRRAQAELEELKPTLKKTAEDTAGA